MHSDIATSRSWHFANYTFLVVIAYYLLLHNEVSLTTDRDRRCTYSTAHAFRRIPTLSATNKLADGAIATIQGRLVSVALDEIKAESSWRARRRRARVPQSGRTAPGDYHNTERGYGPRFTHSGLQHPDSRMIESNVDQHRLRRTQSSIP